jgi:hypothetical protein
VRLGIPIGWLYSSTKGAMLGRAAIVDVHSTVQGMYKPRPRIPKRPEISGWLSYCTSPAARSGCFRFWFRKSVGVRGDATSTRAETTASGARLAVPPWRQSRSRAVHTARF